MLESFSPRLGQQTALIRRLNRKFVKLKKNLNFSRAPRHDKKKLRQQTALESRTKKKNDLGNELQS